MDRELFIDGGWRKAVGGARLEIRDPATGERVGSTALASATDVDRAVAAAQRARPIWAESHADERCRIMLRAADLIERRTDAIAMMLTREQGKPVLDSAKEIGFGVRVLRYYAEEGRRIEGSVRFAEPKQVLRAEALQNQAVGATRIGMVHSSTQDRAQLSVICKSR